MLIRVNRDQPESVSYVVDLPRFHASTKYPPGKSHIFLLAVESYELHVAFNSKTLG